MSAPRFDEFSNDRDVESPSFANAGEGERSTQPSLLHPFLLHPLSCLVSHQFNRFNFRPCPESSIGDEIAQGWEAGSPWLPGSHPLRGSTMCFPTGARVALYLDSSYFAPFPGPALSGSPPLAGSALVGAPLARLPRRVGGPLSFCSVLPLFCYSFVT